MNMDTYLPRAGLQGYFEPQHHPGRLRERQEVGQLPLHVQPELVRTTFCVFKTTFFISKPLFVSEPHFVLLFFKITFCVGLSIKTAFRVFRFQTHILCCIKENRNWHTRNVRVNPFDGTRPHIL